MRPNVIDIKVTAKDNASGTFGRIRAGITGIGTSAIAATAQFANFVRNVTLGAAAITTAIGFKALNAASDAQETFSKFATVFSDVGQEAQQVADNLARDFGLSSVAARRLLGDTGDLLTGFGVAGDVALQMSKDVNQLAVDLASFTNASGGAEAVSQALTKALLGERESLKTYGIAIMETDIQAELLAQGMSDLTGEALRQAKAQVTLDLAMRQSRNAVGDFARTQDSFANRMRVAQARIGDFLIELGGLNKDGTLKPGGLLDVGTQLLNKLIIAFENNQEAIIAFVDNGLLKLKNISMQVIDVVRTMGDRLLKFAEFLGLTTEDAKLFIMVAGGLTFAITGLALAIGLLTSPIFLVAAAIAAVSLGVVLLKKAWDENFLGIQETLQPVVDTVSQGIAKITAFIITNKDTWIAIGETVTTVSKHLIDVLTPTFNMIKTQITSAINILGELIAFVKNVVTGDWDAAWENIKSITENAINGILAPINMLGDQIDVILSKIDEITGINIGGIPGSLGLPGFATGGQFTVGGGGGTDSQLVAFKATPGERVTIETPAQQAQGGTNNEIVMNNYFSSDVSAESVAQRLNFQLGAI